MLLKSVKKLIEGITVAGAVLMSAGGHPLCVAAGIILFITYGLEREAWEGGV